MYDVCVYDDLSHVYVYALIYVRVRENVPCVQYVGVELSVFDTKSCDVTLILR